MNVWKVMFRILFLVAIALIVAIAVRFFIPKIQEERKLRAQLEAARQNVQQTADTLRILKLKQEKLRSDPRYIEKVAREELGYAKSGETVFRFVDEED